MKKVISIIVLSLLLIAMINLFFVKPALTPNNIHIDYEFKTTMDDLNYLQLKLDNSHKEITFSENNFYQIYVFPPDSIRDPIIDYPDFQDSEYYIGSDSRTYNIAKNAMKDKNIYINESNSIDGFYYDGAKYPAVFDYYYYESDHNESSNNNKGYIVFAYYEKKLFKDLSWTKVYPIIFE